MRLGEVRGDYVQLKLNESLLSMRNAMGGMYPYELGEMRESQSQSSGFTPIWGAGRDCYFDNI